MSNRKLYEHIAGLLLAMANCRKTGNQEWLAKHREVVEALVADHMPSGSGWDRGTKLDFDASGPDKLVFNGSFHHMDENGYNGWTDHTVTVRPSLAFGIEVKVSGRDRGDIKDMLSEDFSECLTREVAR